MLVLGLDFETQGKDPNNTNITEIGAVLANVEGRKYAICDAVSSLVYDESYPPQSEEVILITGITDEMLKSGGKNLETELKLLVTVMEKADVVMAYNANFDRTIFEQVCTKLLIEYPKKPWICAMNDVPYPPNFTCKKLSHLALDHMLKMDNRDLHRAVSDVRLMLDLVVPNYGIEEVMAYAAEPWIFVKADIPAPWTDGGVGKDNATKLGFSWERPRGLSEPLFHKTWVKRIKKSKLESEISQAQFPVQVIG